ncbi:MAG: PaaI family thioesterase [Hyphomicrobiales bacterium]
MAAFTPRNPDFEALVRRSFEKQRFMAYLEASLSRIVPGEVDIVLPSRDELSQQHGYFHAGATVSIADSAAGYAALTLFKPGCGVLTTEFKVNLLAPAQGEKLVARGKVLKPGRTLTICQSDVVAIDDGQESHVATALLTMMQIEGLEE